MIQPAKRRFAGFSRPQKFGPRAEYRQQENERVRDSVTLARKFKSLKSLKVELIHNRSHGTNAGQQLKYAVNLAHAKSVFRFDCMNHDCVGGDFNLSQKLADAVRARQAIVTGEMCCEGWSSKDSINTLRCDCLLHYKLRLKFARTQAAIEALNGRNQAGRNLVVNAARPREERSASGFGGGRGPRRGSYAGNRY